MHSWTTAWRLMTMYPRSWRRAAVRLCSWLKEMGNYWACFWLIAFWGPREVPGLWERRAQAEVLPVPQCWDTVNKTCSFQHWVLGHSPKCHMDSPCLLGYPMSNFILNIFCHIANICQAMNKGLGTQKIGYIYTMTTFKLTVEWVTYVMIISRSISKFFS